MLADTSKNYLVLTLVVVFAYLAKTLISIDISHIFWDLNVYDRGVSDYLKGDDPYRHNASLLFIYHPYVLKAFVFLNDLFNIKIWFICFYFFATTFFIRELLFLSKTAQKTFSVQKENISFVLLAAALCFGDAGLHAIKTGNVTIFLHFSLIASFFYAYRSGSIKGILSYALLITFFSVIKPYLLAYVLLLPYLTRRNSIFYLGLLICLFCFLIWVSGSYLTPELYSNFMGALHYQTLGKGDLGYSVFGLFVHKTEAFYGITFHSLIMLSYLLLIFLYAKVTRLDWRSSYFIPLLIIFIIFINPRMKVYDFPIAILFGYLHLWLFSISQLRATKVIFASMVLASVPTLFGLLKVRFGFEPSEILTNIRIFHILGFIVVLFGIINAAYVQWRSVKSS